MNDQFMKLNTMTTRFNKTVRLERVRADNANIHEEFRYQALGDLNPYYENWINYSRLTTGRFYYGNQDEMDLGIKIPNDGILGIIWKDDDRIWKPISIVPAGYVSAPLRLIQDPLKGRGYTRGKTYYRYFNQREEIEDGYFSDEDSRIILII